MINGDGLLQRSWPQATLARCILPMSVLAPAAAPWVWPFSPVAALAMVACAHAPLFYGTFVPNRRLFGPVVRRLPGVRNEVWLTIDDGPDPADTPRILDVLDEAEARATFFVRGDRARRSPRLVEEIVARGHELGNHTFSHPHRTFWGLSPSRIGEEMDRCNEVLRAVVGKPARKFRAPVGMINPFVNQAAQERGMQIIGWSARGFDACRRGADPETVAARIERDLAPGGIVLLHEGVGNGAPHRNMALLLRKIAARGWRATLPLSACSRSAQPVFAAD